MNTITKAQEFAMEKHKGQKYGKIDPFWVHPAQTVDILKATIYGHDENLLAAGWLHDTLEDTETTYEELVKEFNVDVADLVNEVTATGWNVFPNLKTQRGIILKFADRLANISNMSGWSQESKRKYIFEKSKFWK